MSARFKTPPRPPTNATNAPRKEGSRFSPNSYLTNAAVRDSVVERSPTLVGDSPPPRLSLSRASQSVSCRETKTADKTSPVTPSISARKKPSCRKCGTPMKGHKRGQCTPSAHVERGKSLYASSPETERTPTNAAVTASQKSAFSVSTSSISGLSTTSTSSVSIVGNRRIPVHKACGMPMKGHRRINNKYVCITSDDPNLTPTRGCKTPNDENQPPVNRVTDVNTSIINIPPTPADSLVHEDGSTPLPYSPAKNRRSITPTSTSSCASHRSSKPQSSPLAYISEGGRSRSTSPTSESIYSSVSAYAPSQASSQSDAAKPSYEALHSTLGPPEFVVYPACNANEVMKLRLKAKELHFYSGVVNVKVWEHEGFNVSELIKRGGVVCDVVHDVPSCYTKWVIISERKEMVQKCIDLCGERLSEC